MLSRQEIERMRAAIEVNLRQSIETECGECIAVNDETGEEWGHKWRGGEARVYAEPEEDDDDPELAELPGVDYVFAVQVVLVSVEPE